MKKVFILLLTATVLLSCKKKHDTTAVPGVTTDEKQNVVNNYANIVYASYQDSYTTLLTLQQDAQTFLANPTAQGFTKLKEDWLEARIPYEQTETYRFYNGPIDWDSIGDPIINSWPLDGSYIDYFVNPVTGDTSKTGIVYDSITYPTISQTVIINLNTAAGDEDVTTGYHAVEFLLWGQNFHITGPGSRPYTDYVVGAGSANSNQARRSLYLITAINLLVSNVKSVMNQWAPNATNYRSHFVAQDPNISLKLIMTGMGEYGKGELAGQRISVAYINLDPHEAHSCFSDNSTNDVILGQQGIYNVYMGRYVRVDGTVIDGSGINDLVQIANSSLNNTIMTNYATANAAAIDLPPLFDQAVLEKSPKLLTAINAIKAESDQIVVVAQALGINITDN
jgi:putative iron-regulated protein